MKTLVAQCRTHAVMILSSLLLGMVLSFVGYVTSTAGYVMHARQTCQVGR